MQKQSFNTDLEFSRELKKTSNLSESGIVGGNYKFCEMPENK